jgi:C4-dicarboxylate-specific signal transduction histidine kinase/ABC-type uncharacterized transport system substrate-binding protein
MATTSNARTVANVLLIFSNDRLLPANVEVERGLREVVTASSEGGVEIFTEFLGVPAFSGEAYESRTAAYLKEKYAERRPRVIVAAGMSALDFVVRHRQELFPDVTLAHVGVSGDYFKSHSARAADVIGIPVEYDLAGTAELALRLHPHPRKIVVVTGASRWDRDRETEARANLASSALDVPVEYLTGLPTADVLATLAHLRPDDVVLTPGYFRDGAGRDSSPRDSVAVMASVSGAPIYGQYSTFLGTGAVGGSMSSYTEMGRETGTILNRILDGAPVSSIDVPARIRAVPQLDWRQVRKWGIDEGAIPQDALIHFRQPTLWEAYRTQALVGAAVITLQAGLIIALLVERRLRRKTAIALAKSEQRVTLAAHAARLSTWMWDLARGRVWSDPMLRQRAGLSREVPESFDQILATVHPADRERFADAVREAAANDTELDVEYRVLQSGGEVRWFAARGHAAIGAPHCLTGVKMDITARKAAEVQAASDRAALTHMSRVSTMGQLSAAIAHQLNQPLAAILGNAETACKMLGREQLDIKELREILDDIVTEDHRAAEVIRRLGALYKRGEVEMTPLDLNELVRETLDLVRAELVMRQVSIVADLMSPECRIVGGRVQLQQVLLNLMLNAADAMSGVEVAERVITIRTVLEGDSFALYVIDRGAGIAPDDLKRVFTPFWSTKSTGVGVGLAICYAIVSAHRGALTAANNLGGGAAFCMKLPAVVRA